MKKTGILFLIGVILCSFVACSGKTADHLESTQIETTVITEPESAPMSAEDIYSYVSPSVVEITGESFEGISTGTGFFYDDKGTVITNYHVIENCQTAEITLSNGDSYKVKKVLGYDSDIDIAILSTACKESTPLSFRTTNVKTGETVYAMGSSLGLTSSLSDGIVSAVNRKINGNTYIQTTAPVSHGNSGGPLVDTSGEVIGIICAYLENGQNLNLAIPIDEVEEVSLNNGIKLEELFPVPEQKVEWISNYEFFYYSEEDIYVLLFQLADEDEIPISARGAVDIRIVNDYGVTVYSNTHTFTDDNFIEWILNDTEEIYLATIEISPSKIMEGSTEFGTVYFEVYGDDYSFEEQEVYVYDLPVDDSYIDNGFDYYEPKDTCLAYGCKNEVDYFGDYCVEHKCSNSLCSYQKEAGSEYCSLCCCSKLDCKNGRISGGYYCSEHTCIVSGCTSEKEFNSEYCYWHECNEVGCHNKKNEYGYYCSEHECAVSGCTSSKSILSDYCFLHED